MITVPLLELVRSITAFPNDLLLVWDWDASQGKLQDEGYYERLIGSWKKSRCPRTECKCHDYLDEATRLWDFGLLLNGLERYEEAGKNLRDAVEVYGTALRSVDNSHDSWRESNEEALRVMDDLLIEDKGAESKDNDGRTPLSQATGSGHEAFARLLLDKGADIEAKDNDGRTPLSQAAGSGHEAVVRLLLDKGADIEAKNNKSWMPLYGQTPLLQAAGSGYEAVVRLLLDKGADIKAKDKYGRTPLWWAARSRHEAVVRLLESHSALSS
ncbi:hypothetical protein V2G26_007071 [Clonostachys chloroleuca]